MMMRSLICFSILVVFISTSCLDNTILKKEKKVENEADDFSIMTWIGADSLRSDSEYEKEFKVYKENGISAVLINSNADVNLLERVAKIAVKENLKVHAWLMTINRPGDKEALKHPDWYQVNRKGESCFDKRPYVEYYQWLCPTREGSRKHILKLVENLANVEGIESVHLDYIRYSDIFLPIGLLPNYKLEQNSELPEFDYCYCDVCIKEFESIHHKNPKKMAHPELDMEWKQFRLNQVKKIVDESYKIVHKKGKKLSAAVFPYPEMADHMVRQRWDKWNVDMVFPMVYHNFYNEELDWVGFVTKQGIEDLEGKSTELYTGLYLPEMSGKDLDRAIHLAKENGAKGIGLFDGGALTSEHLVVIKKWNDKENEK